MRLCGCLFVVHVAALVSLLSYTWLCMCLCVVHAADPWYTPLRCLGMLCTCRCTVFWPLRMHYFSSHPRCIHIFSSCLRCICLVAVLCPSYFPIIRLCLPSCSGLVVLCTGTSFVSRTPLFPLFSPRLHNIFSCPFCWSAVLQSPCEIKLEKTLSPSLHESFCCGVEWRGEQQCVQLN